MLGGLVFAMSCQSVFILQFSFWFPIVCKYLLATFFKMTFIHIYIYPAKQMRGQSNHRAFQCNSLLDEMLDTGHVNGSMTFNLGMICNTTEMCIEYTHLF